MINEFYSVRICILEIKGIYEDYKVLIQNKQST